MEPMGQVTLQVTLAQLVIRVTLVLVKLSRGLTLPILEPMKVGSQTILFMTLLLERTRLGTLTTMKMYPLQFTHQTLQWELRRTFPV